MNNPTREEIANSYELWGEYVDSEGVMSELDFDNMTVNEKIQMQEDIFCPAVE